MLKFDKKIQLFWEISFLRRFKEENVAWTVIVEHASLAYDCLR